MTPPDIAAARALADAATEGPLVFRGKDSTIRKPGPPPYEFGAEIVARFTEDDDGRAEVSDGDADLWMAASTLVPQLCDALEREREESHDVVIALRTKLEASQAECERLKNLDEQYLRWLGSEALRIVPIEYALGFDCISPANYLVAGADRMRTEREALRTRLARACELLAKSWEPDETDTMDAIHWLESDVRAFLAGEVKQVKCTNCNGGGVILVWTGGNPQEPSHDEICTSCNGSGIEVKP
jgi:hypothetical protein